MSTGHGLELTESMRVKRAMPAFTGMIQGFYRHGGGGRSSNEICDPSRIRWRVTFADSDSWMTKRDAGKPCWPCSSSGAG